jgi:hypothetical protein
MGWPPSWLKKPDGNASKRDTNDAWQDDRGEGPLGTEPSAGVRRTAEAGRRGTRMVRVPAQANLDSPGGQRESVAGASVEPRIPQVVPSPIAAVPGPGEPYWQPFPPGGPVEPGVRAWWRSDCTADELDAIAAIRTGALVTVADEVVSRTYGKTQNALAGLQRRQIRTGKRPGKPPGKPPGERLGKPG